MQLVIAEVHCNPLLVSILFCGWPFSKLIWFVEFKKKEEGKYLKEEIF